MRTIRYTLVAAAVVATAAATTPAQPDDSIFGFAPGSIAAQRQVESRFLALPSEARTREFHRYLTAEPHVAGSPRNKELAEWQRRQWIDWGVEDVAIVTHDVLLPYPQEVRVEMTAPRPWRASLREDPIPGDTDTLKDPGIPYHAYSASGDLTAPVVYAGSGNPENYDWLEAQGIEVKGKIALVRYSVPYSYRGFKALTAQQRGLAGIIIYSDPADDGYGKGKTYPEGPWGPESHIQRGGIPFDFLVPGDPLTPGWASVPGAKRIDPADAVSIPTIVSVPMSYRDARVILEALDGPEVPAAWRGGLPIAYRAGGAGATVRMVVRIDSEVRQIQTVTGRIRGAERPDEEIILGNHRDAWVFGGVDPSSGSATLMDLARSLGALVRAGVRPKRTIVLASWDAEEFTLTSSTEWGEQFAEDLARRAIAYINVDSSASGRRFTASAVPSLNRLVADAARDVRDPQTGESIVEATRRLAESAERGSLPNAAGNQLVNNRLGSGSDYTVFLNFLGISIVDMSFDGPYGVYHSMYDDHQWVSRIGDPGFRYHAKMTRLWGLMALRLANADVLPFDYPGYAARLREFAVEVEKRWLDRRPAGQNSGSESPFKPVHEAVARFAAAASAVRARQAAALTGSSAGRDELNRMLMQVERAFIDPAGIPGRPWYRHQIYAPKFTYAPEILPGPAEAIAAGDEARLREQIARVAAAITRAANTMQPAAARTGGPRNDLPQPYRTTRDWGPLPAGVKWAAVTAVEPSPDGSIYVIHRCFANSCEGRSEPPILKFDADGRLLKAWGEGLFVFPHGATIDRDGHLWVTDARGANGKGHQVFEFDADGRVLRTLGQAGKSGGGPTLFDQPNDVVVAPGGDIFVADSHRNGANNRIVKFTRDGTFEKEWGRKGSGRGEFSEPHTIALDSRGRLFVGDRENNRIQIFDQDGRFLEEWRQFGRPSGIVITADDAIYVADSESGPDTGAHELPGIRKGIRIGSARTGEVTAFIEDMESTAPDHSGAEGLGVDRHGNVYGAVVRRQMLERHVKVR